MFKLLIFTIILFSISYAQNGTKYLIETSLGNIKIKLYDDTPLHKENFIKLVKNKYYDGVRFHRVIKDFMIQTGDSNSKDINNKASWGQGGPGYTIAAEFKRNHFHKKGALSAARQADQVNPDKRSSGSQFYIVQGKKYSDVELDQLEQQLMQGDMNNFAKTYWTQPQFAYLKQIDWQKLQKENPDSLTKLNKKLTDDMTLAYQKSGKSFKFTPEERNTYKTSGGTPFLDTQYTVFGEVEQGLEIVDLICNSQTEPGDRPVQDIFIKSVKLISEK